MFGEFYNSEGEEKPKKNSDKKSDNSDNDASKNIDDKLSKIMKYLDNMIGMDINRKPDEVKVTIKNGYKKTVSIWKDGETEITSVDIVRVDEDELEEIHDEEADLQSAYDLAIKEERFEMAGVLHKELKKLKNKSKNK